jgi:hypothetical protein
MPGVLAFDIYEPDSPRAAELLAAIAAKLGVEKIETQPRDRHVMVYVPDWERAYRIAEEALDEGDEGRMVVRPLTPP